MKLAKRIIAIALLVSLCLSMIACSSSSANIFGVTTPTTPLAVSDSSTQSDTEPSAAYQNDFFGYSCVLPDDWYVLNDKEISKMIGTTNEAFSDIETYKLLQKSLDSGESQVDFYAYSPDYSQTVSVILVKENLLEMLLQEKILLEAAMPISKSTLEEMGVTNISHNTEKISFLGKEHVALYVEGDIQGETIYQVTVLLRKGSYMSNFSVSGYDQAALQTQLDYFQVIQ